MKPTVSILARALAPIIVILSYAHFANAQSLTGIVSGQVRDRNHQPVAYAQLTIEELGLKNVTDETGNFLWKLPVGEYVLQITAPHFEAASSKLTIRARKQASMLFELDVADKMLAEVAISGVKIRTATATRTSLELQDIPQALSVVGQREIRQQAAFNLSTILRNVAGINFTGTYSGAGSAEFFNARGFDLNETQNYRWNGMMVWNWGDLYADNIEQVEFLKGPTSILYGDVAPGGILNLVTKKPLAEFKAELNFRTGSWGLARPAIDITGPLTKKANLRYRLNTSFQYQGSFRDQVSARKVFIAPALTWDLSSKFSINAEAVFNNASSTDDAGLVSPDGTVAGLSELSPSLYLGEPSRRYQYRNQQYALSANYQLGKNWRLKAAGFYAYSINRPFGIWFGQPDDEGDFARNGYGFYQYAHNRTVSTEINGLFYTGDIRHHLLAGLEYQSTGRRYTNGGTLSELDSSNLKKPLIGHVTEDPPISPLQPLTSIIERKGLFLQDQIAFWKDRLQFLFGIRIGSTRQGEHYFVDPLTGNRQQDNIVSNVVYTPRFGLVFKARDEISFYASWSKGYEINSPDIFARNYRDYMTPPATISQQLEAGAKVSLLQSRLGLTLSVYEINKHNPYGYVYLNPDNPDYDQYNIYYSGHHRSRGVELEVNGYLSPELSVAAAGSYTATKVIYDPGYPTGNRLPNAPKYTANTWLNYEPQLLVKGLNIGAGIFYKDRFYSTLDNSPLLQLPANYTLDAALGYHYKSAGIQLNVRNLTNKVAYRNPWQFNLYDVQPLREFILTFSYRFTKRN